MTTRRVWLGAYIVLLLAVAAFWLKTSHDDPQVAGSVTPAVPSAALSVAQASSVLTPPPQSANRFATPLQTQKGYAIAGDGSFAVPNQYQFAGVDRVLTANGFENWMSHFSEADQKMLRAFDDRNHGVYRGRTAQSVAWMAAHGYPMPEDLIAAEAISTNDLRQMAKEGNLKAAFLLRDRDLTEFTWKIKNQGASIGNSGNEDPQFVADEDMLQPIFLASDSPYKAYMVARSAAVEENPLSRDAQILAAMDWAIYLGDLGAGRVNDRYIWSDPARVNIRKAIDSGVLAAGTLFRKSMQKMGNNGCVRDGVAPEYNPTMNIPGG